ncbi:filamentous hemagglutinin N-terminal domain-containing protein [Dolichospermum sp. UHCC 0299]|uniref:two-partner secretion domain-containing protein n=2 Tax=unclassified Dolichospermum TaxID=2622029 RepID=UPI001C2B9914|nr:filamentous hemagglutinin N-terminal domain-containing protein [Dolichospermum sp. UHCC 0299]
MLLSPAKIAIAQITPDATLGNESSRVTPANLIEGGAQRGSSLFHSFSEFNVNNLQSVYFANPSGINNIFSRVTGNNVSHILGTLGVNGTANLYLLNPNGIIFGKDAQLDIKGAFFASTANSFIFPGGNEFSATNPQMPLLTMSVPVGVQFGSQPGDISSQGNLEVGKDLTFSAKNVKLEGQLQAQTATLEANQDLNIGDYTGISLQGKAGGNINYGKIEINNTDPNITSNDPSLLLNAVGTITGSGNISTTIPGLLVDLQAKDNINIKDISTKGGEINITSSSGVNPGLITVNAIHDITTGNINSSSISENGGAISLKTTQGNISTQSLNSSTYSDSGTAGNGGEMTLTAGGNIETQSLNSYSDSNSGTAGNGGGMTLTAGGNIETQSLNSYSDSNSGTAGNGGGMTLTAGGNIETQSLNSYSDSNSGTAGNGGGMTLTAGGNIETQSLNSYSDSDSGTGNSGGITLTAGGNINTQSLDSHSYSSSGTVNGGGMTLTAGGNINTQSLYSYSYSDSGTGNGGGITLTAGGNINTQSLDSSSSGTAGNGGGMTLTAGGNINTQSLDSYSFSGIAGNGGGMTLTAGGNINTQSLDSYSFSGIAGNGGGITLTAGDNINTQSLDSSSLGTAGNAGNITLKISEGNIFIPYIISYATGKGGNGGTIQLTGDKLDINGIVINSDGQNGSNGGLIKLDSPLIQLTNSDLSSSSYGSGKSGQIELNSTGDINLNNSRLFTTLEPGSTGQGGNIEVKAQNLNLTNYAVINTGTYSSGNAGNIKITAENVSLKDGSSLQSLTTDKGNAGNISLDVANGNISLNTNSSISTSATKIASGNSGNIKLNSRTLSLSNGSQIQALTEGEGRSKAGEITVDASDSITISGVDSNFTNSDPNALPPQNIIKTDYVDDYGLFYVNNPLQKPTLDIGTNNSISTAQQLQASDFYVNNPQQKNRNVEYSTRVPYVSLKATGDDKIHVYAIKVNAGTKAVFDIDYTGDNSSGTKDTRDYKIFPAVNTKLTLLDSQGKELASNNDSPHGLGAAGSNAKMTLQQDPYLRYTFTQGGTYYIQVSDSDGQGVPSGNDDFGIPKSYNLQISLEPNPIQANITSQGQPSGIFAYTTGAGKAGDITLKTGDLKLENSGQISAFTKGSGNGGSVNITASQNINITGQGKLAVESSGTGNGGDISITSLAINLTDNAKIEVDSTSSANTSSAGTITMKTNLLKLDNAAITARNASGNGGNIDVTTENLLLRHNSEISTTAGSANNPGNGGKITINAKNGYVVAVSTEDSDIIANAFGGNGGKIDISAIRVLGLETRGRLNTAQLQTIRTNETSDITASSDVGTDGTVAIQSLGIDPSQGLVAIPVNLIDPSGLIAQDCNSNNSNSAQSQSEFVITGRGGLPPSPDDVLTVGALPAKWVTREKGDRAILPIGVVPTTTAPLIEAQGMVRNANGDIVLIAQPVISTNFYSGLSSQLCRITQNHHKL